MNLKEKLMNIQKELKAPKNQKNSFGNYNYRSCEDILEAVKPLLDKYKCVLTIQDELVVLGESNPLLYSEQYYDKDLKKENTRNIITGYQRFYIKSKTILSDVESDESISNEAYAREEETKKGMDASQITGAASSYARKYALNGLFAIDDTKDADTDTYQKQTKIDSVEKKKATIIKNDDKKTFREQLISKCKNENIDVKEISEKYNLSKESTEEDYEKALNALNAEVK